MTRFTQAILLCAAMAVSWGNAHAQTTDPAAATAPADPAWQLSCGENGNCRMGQNYTANGKVVSRLLLYKVGDKEIVEGLLPLGFSQLELVSIVVDNEVQFPMRVITCKPTGCLAFSPEAGKIVQAFRRGLEAKLSFVGFDDGKPYHYPFSLIGFSKLHGEYKAQQ